MIIATSFMWRDVKCKIHNLFARDFQAFANKSLPSHLFFRSISKRGDNLKWAEPTLVAVNNNYCLNNCRFSRDWFGFCWFDNNSVATSNLRSPCFTLQHPHPATTLWFIFAWCITFEPFNRCIIDSLISYSTYLNSWRASAEGLPCSSQAAFEVDASGISYLLAQVEEFDRILARRKDGILKKFLCPFTPD